jgi:hypothetical protein
MWHPGYKHNCLRPILKEREKKKKKKRKENKRKNRFEKERKFYESHLLN